MPTVAINGLGRIGRAALKILLDADGLDLVAVNDIADADNLAYLIKYDTVYGRYPGEVRAVDGALLLDGRRIAAFAERDQVTLPWADLGVDLGLECTGVFRSDEGLHKHLQARVDHAAHHGLGEEEDRPVQLQVGVVDRAVVLQEGLGDEEARRVDQQGRIGVMVSQLLLGPRHLHPVGEVGGDAVGRAVLRQGCDRFIDPVLFPADDDGAATARDDVGG